MRKSRKKENSTELAVVDKTSTALAILEQQVEFVLERTPGLEVFIAGTFNDWNPGLHRLYDENGTGVYRRLLALAPGEYEYKFVINGEWVIDDKNADFTSNDFGTLNSVLKVSHKK